MSDPKIGVFVCHCGSNIGGIVDVPAVTEYASKLKNVVCAKDNLYTCSDSGLREIKESIEEHDLDRVVVASCTPRTHERLFRNTCEEAGLNKFLFEFANIRDQCSWVHMKNTEKATEKAKDLVRMGVAKARLLQPMEDIEIDVVPSAMVVGGGIAGMSAALSMANMGVSTYLVEREPQLGGMLNRLHALYPSHIKAAELVDSVKEKVVNHPNIDVLTSTEVKDIQGFIGNYEATVENDQSPTTLKVGAVIVATGAQALAPEGEYGYKSMGTDGQEIPRSQKVVTQLELEQILADEQRCKELKDIVMIQCVGSRTEGRSYCSRACCVAAVKNSVLLKEANPDVNVFVLFRDIQTYTSGFEDYYAEAREKGVIFIRYSEERPPELVDSVVGVYDELLGAQLGIPYDLLVLSTPLVPYDDAKELATMLKIPLEENGFFLEAHVKLRPVDFATDGVYLAGCARWPALVGEAISQAQAAASRAAIPLLNGHVQVEPIISSVDEELCAGCELCESLCAFKAIQLEMTEAGRKARVITASCKGCGSCGAACPQHAITMQHFTNAQIEAQIDALVSI
ncbi:CoB--CoM heterodisulfide reductase iron-sulfur subunit A family protein [Candidatus Poribacteria bacterium]